MKKYDDMFKQEQKANEVQKELASNERRIKENIIADFCKENLFDFLSYLQAKFYIQKHSVNFRVDGNVYERDIVEGFEGEEKAIADIKRYGYFKAGINYKWSNGGNYDTIVVHCINFKPVLSYENKVVSVTELESIVVAQIQKAIEAKNEAFKIIEY